MARRGEDRALRRVDSRRYQGACVLDEATNAVGAARERNLEDDEEQAQVVVGESEQGMLSAVCCTLRHLVTRTRVYRGQLQPVFMVSHRICLYVPRYIHVEMFTTRGSIDDGPRHATVSSIHHPPSWSAAVFRCSTSTSTTPPQRPPVPHTRPENAGAET